MLTPTANVRWRCREAEAGHRAPHGFGKALAVGRRALREQDAELVAAEARERIALAQLAAHDRRDLPDQLVTGGMPAGIVHHFELVQVQVHQRVRAAVGAHLRDRRGQAALELGPVDQSGQRVVAGLVGQPGGMFAFLADVVQHHDHADGLRRAVADQRHGGLYRHRASAACDQQGCHARPALLQRQRDQIAQRRLTALLAKLAHLL